MTKHRIYIVLHKVNSIIHTFLEIVSLDINNEFVPCQ